MPNHLKKPPKNNSTIMDETPCSRKRKDGVMYVQRNSLVESDLKLEHEKIKSVIQNKPREYISESDLLEERRAANRLSAFQSRKRRKAMIDGLQKMVADLSAVNTKLHSTADELQAELKQVNEENAILRQECLEGKNRKKPHVAPPRQDAIVQAPQQHAPMMAAPSTAPPQNYTHRPMAALPTKAPQSFSQMPFNNDTANQVPHGTVHRPADHLAIELILEIMKGRIGQR